MHELKAEPGTTLHPGTLCRALRGVVKHAGLDPEKVLFLDECEAKTNLVRTHGRAPVGTRLVAKVPHGHWINNVRLRTGTTRLTDLEDACGEALNHFSTAEIQNYMIHGGYRYESVQHALMGAGPR
ncbi:MAG: hypothetical protein Q8K78_15050 [Planctomycetaceae bacterium]|nr:hypothetical protein [Planctomycetaceae bacterium]